MNLPPLATWALVGACIAAFLGQLAGGGGVLLSSADVLRAAGAVDAVRVWQGEVWRLFSALFVHAGVWHLGLNLWVLWQVGRLLEPILGTARFVLVYLVSGIVGFAASLLWHPGLSLGASGAIFGAVGGLLALAAVTKDTPLGKHLLRALAPFVVATLVIGFFLPFVDNTAHVGGLIAGFLLSYGLFADAKDQKLEELRAAGILEDHEALRLRPRHATAALVLSMVLFAVIVPLSLKPFFSPRYHASLGFAALRAHDLDEATARVQAAERRAPGDGAVLLLRGRVLLEGADAEEQARAFFREALASYDQEDPRAALALARADAGLVGEEEYLFGDERLSGALCELLLGEGDGDGARAESGAADAPARDLSGSPILLNDCAWLLLKADDPRVHDARRALALAKKAVARAGSLANGAKAALWHTLAEAHAQNGDPEEARIILERIVVQELSSDPLYREERARFAALAAAASAGPPREPAAP